VGHNALSQGLLATDIASAQAFSLFSATPSASYYNPASLVGGHQQEMHFGFGFTDPDITLNTVGGDAPLRRVGSEMDVSESESLFIGVQASLNKILTIPQPVAFGLVTSLEGYGATALSVNDSTSGSGQAMQYGEKPLFLSAAMGVEVVPGVSVGLGTTVSLGADASMDIESTLDGVTRNERLTVEAKTRISPVAGVAVRGADVFCQYRGPDCVLAGLNVAFSYRGESKTETDVSANAVIPGVIPEPGLDLLLAAMDGYQPDVMALGVSYQWSSRLRTAFTIEQQSWQELMSQLAPGNVNMTRDQANIQLQDTVVPRLAVSYDIAHWTVNFGYAREASPLLPGLTPDVNLIDNDRQVFSAGVAFDFQKVPMLAWPAKVQVVFQHHRLKSAQFDFSRLDSSDTVEEFETVETGGEVNTIALSFALYNP
jgi:long-subunit fatty acid transport protein